MYWQDKPAKATFIVSDEIQDLSFRIRARALPVDHAHALSSEIRRALPWFDAEPDAGLHLIHVAESGNGWYRPADPKTDVLHLSRRTRLRLRLPKTRLDDARILSGRLLDVGGHEILVGEASARPLSSLATIFSRYVKVEEHESESEFVDNRVALLTEMGIRVRKFLCGRQSSFDFPHARIFVRSVMLADLEIPDSVLLQQRGLGPGRKLGFGLFVPHKGVKAIVNEDD